MSSKLCSVLLLYALFVINNGCKTELDCELNGQCVNNECKCNAPWIGTNCSFLDRLNVNPNIQFYEGPLSSTNVSSWGGNFIYDTATKLYHLYVSMMINNCGLKIWQHGSYCAHATSSNPLTEPFKFSDIAVPVQCHNAQINRFSSKYNNQWLLVHQYDGYNNGTLPTCCTNITNSTYGPDNYCNGTTPYQNVPYVPAPPPPDGFKINNILHTSANPYGPWKPVNISISGGNPTAYIDDDDSIYFIMSNKALYHGYINYPDFTEIVNLTLLHENIQSFWNTSYYANEDSFLWRDVAGYFHVLFHNQNPCNTANNVVYGDGNPTRGGCGGHAYSKNGYDDWYFSPVAAYNASITYSNGTTSNIGARERPKLIFENGSKIPKYLVNGASHHPCQGVDNGKGTCYSTNKYGNDKTFTVIQQLNI